MCCKNRYALLFLQHNILSSELLQKSVFTACRHASAIYAVVVCLSVRLLQAGVLLKRLNVGSRKQRHMIAQGLQFSYAEEHVKIRGHPQRRCQMQVVQVKIGDFRQITRYNSITSTVASVVNLVPSQVYHTERSVHLCFQHVGRDATPRVGSSATS